MNAMPRTLKASLMLGLAGCVYGIYLVLVNVASNNGYGRENLIVGQYLFATVIFGIWILAQYRSLHLKMVQRLKLMIIGAFGFGVNFCLFETVAATNSSFAVTMLFQCVWMGILFDCLVTRRLPPRYTITAGILVLIGMPLAAGFFDNDANVSTVGLLWGFGAALSYVGMIWTSARLETEVPPPVRTFYFALTQTILASLTAPSFFVTSFFDPGAWAYAIPLGLCTGVIPTLIIMKNAPLVPVGIATIMIAMELPSTLVLGMIFLQQSHSVENLFGALLICVGIVVANKKGIGELRRKLKHEEDPPDAVRHKHR